MTTTCPGCNESPPRDEKAWTCKCGIERVYVSSGQDDPSVVLQVPDSKWVKYDPRT